MLHLYRHLLLVSNIADLILLHLNIHLNLLQWNRILHPFTKAVAHIRLTSSSSSSTSNSAHLLIMVVRIMRLALIHLQILLHPCLLDLSTLIFLSSSSISHILPTIPAVPIPTAVHLQQTQAVLCRRLFLDPPILQVPRQRLFYLLLIILLIAVHLYPVPTMVSRC
jgi:hypothetical protein